MMEPKVRSIMEDFIVLTDNKTASVEVNNSELYNRLNASYGGFHNHELIACHEFSEDWSTWEVHPNGDEVVLLLSGAVTFVLESDQGFQSQSLAQPGEYLIVPKGIWHTAKTDVQSKVLFITPGEGTENKPATE